MTNIKKITLFLINIIVIKLDTCKFKISNMLMGNGNFRLGFHSEGGVHRNVLTKYIQINQVEFIYL